MTAVAPGLTRDRTDPDESARRHAAEDLAGLREWAIVSALSGPSAAVRENPACRSAACDALRHIGVAATGPLVRTVSSSKRDARPFALDVRGSEALEVLLTERLDPIVSDVNVPKMDGSELPRRLRTAGYQDTPVILVSTEAEAQDRVNGLRAGANGYAVNPARAPDLLLDVRMLLGRRPPQDRTR